MTYEELQTQIINLGFESKSPYAEKPTIMINAINRAMREIANHFPLISSYKIAQNPLPNLLGDNTENMDTRHYNGTTPLAFTAGGAKSCYFEYTGSGTLTIEDADGTRTVELTGGNGYQEHKAFVNGDVTLTFSGDFSYDIKNIAIYGERYSANVADIPPFREYIRYDFKELTKVDGVATFIDFEDQVQEGNTSSGESYTNIHSFRIEQRHILVLDGREKAQYTVFYRRNPTPITKNTPMEQKIEIDYDREHLLPLLSAWYVWADDEPTKAALWRNDYEGYLVTLLNQKKPKAAQESFVNGMGW